MRLWPYRPSLAYAATALVFGILSSGCGQPSPGNAPATPASQSLASTSGIPASETLEQLEARMDATVWKDEVLAQKYERTFVKLGDDFRATSNKIEVLGSFEFNSIV